VSARELPALSSTPARLALGAGLVVAAGAAAVVLGLSPAVVAILLLVALVAMVLLERSGRLARPSPAAETYPEADRMPPPEEPRPATGRRAEPVAGEWNLWELERRARDYAGGDAVPEEWAAMFRHLREFARSDGALPPQFDSLVRESFPQLTQ
jgi:hypothetical protein